MSTIAIAHAVHSIMKCEKESMVRANLSLSEVAPKVPLNFLTTLEDLRGSTRYVVGSVSSVSIIDIKKPSETSKSRLNQEYIDTEVKKRHTRNFSKPFKSSQVHIFLSEHCKPFETKQVIGKCNLVLCFG